MSFEAMAWAISKECGSPAAKLVLLTLANHTNGHTGQCNPRHKVLAAECEMRVETLKRHIEALSEKGLLQIIPQFAEGVQLPNQYILSVVGGGGEIRMGVDAKNTPTVGANLEGGVGAKNTPPINRNMNQELNQEKKQEALSRRPSIEEVIEYAKEIDLATPNQFFDHYQSNGWKVGGRSPMKDWKAAMRQWKARDFSQPTNRPPQPPKPKWTGFTADYYADGPVVQKL